MANNPINVGKERPASANDRARASYLRRGYLGNLLTRLKISQELLAPTSEISAERSPFLSIITRTQARRPANLREVFLCLASQTDIDFEVLVMGHCLDEKDKSLVHEIIDENPAWLRERIRYCPVERGNRTAPLNEGFAAARGQYIAILDDDEVILAHWVETFRSLHQTHSGHLLRAVALQQEIERVTILEREGLRSVSQFRATYPAEFDYIDHCLTNQSPPVSVAFPWEAFHLLDIHFDETLTTTEDWDYLLRVASLCGTASAPVATAIYHIWPNAESSRTVHPIEEWQKNHYFIWAKMDEDYIILPPGSAAKIRRLHDENERAKHDNRALVEEVRRLHSWLNWAMMTDIKSWLRALFSKK
jgi:glycosyltransferase involved in cell wall biosynthesis